MFPKCARAATCNFYHHVLYQEKVLFDRLSVLVVSVHLRWASCSGQCGCGLTLFVLATGNPSPALTFMTVPFFS